MTIQLQIREIIRIVNAFGSKSSKRVFLPQKKSTQILELAQKFASPGKIDERAWASEICGCSELENKYLLTRSRLNRLLLRQLFHLDIRTGSALRKAVYRNAQEVFYIRILVMLGARRVAMWLIPQALERARKFELTADRIEFLLQLRQNAVIHGDKSNFAKYTYELEEAEQFRAAEMKLRAIDDSINVELVGKVETSEKAKEIAMASRPEAAMLFEQSPTFNIGLNYFRIATLAAESSGNYEENVRLCQQAEQFLSQFPHLNNPVSEGQFAIKRLDSAVATHHFENTSSAIVTCEHCFPDDSNTWFMWKATEFLLRMHEKDFAKASAIHQSISGHARFASQPEQVQQKWAFFGHYSEFASWTLDQSVPLLRRKSFERITRELPIYKRDKAGYNAALLILQQLIFASSGDRDGMIQKSESLKRYISRYLKNRRDTQLYAFLKMLILLEKCDFDIAQAERRGAGFIAQFRRYGHEIVDEKQTLPYDLMWDWIAEWTRKYAPKSQKSKPKNLPAAKKEETQWKALVQ